MSGGDEQGAGPRSQRRPAARRHSAKVMPGRTVCLLLVGALAAAVAAATTRAAPAAATGERRYVDRLGWSFAYPPTMQLERSQASLRIDVSEVTAANFAMRPAVHSGSTANGAWLRVDPPRNRHAAFPADGVAFRIMRREGGPAPDVELP